MTTHQQSVHAQFNPQAKAYLDSAVHAQGEDLLRARQLIQQAIPPSGLGLDVGCGAGNLSYALSPLLSRMTALDPSEAMLATVRETAKARGLGNIETMQGTAEALPFADACFDVVATRYSAHHWLVLDRALAEMRRVLKPGGFLLIIDVEAPSCPLVDTHFQALELLHDPSHVRDGSEAEWRCVLGATGCEILEYSRWPVRLDFNCWVANSRTPPAKVAMIRMLQSEAPIEVSKALATEKDGSFTLQTALIWSRAEAMSITSAR